MKLDSIKWTKVCNTCLYLHIREGGVNFNIRLRDKCIQTFPKDRRVIFSNTNSGPKYIKQSVFFVGLEYNKQSLFLKMY